MNHHIPFLFLILFGACASAAGEARFKGGAVLAPAIPISADGRFSINAELQHTDNTQVTGRFVLTASIGASADAKSIATSCGALGVDLFKNDFEN
jgi:hypothetical protein